MTMICIINVSLVQLVIKFSFRLHLSTIFFHLSLKKSEQLITLIASYNSNLICPVEVDSFYILIFIIVEKISVKIPPVKKMHRQFIVRIFLRNNLLLLRLDK